MSALATSTKAVILELHINADRDTVELVEQIAKALDVAIGEHERREWVRLMHLRTINKEN